MNKINPTALYFAFALTGCASVTSNAPEPKSASGPQPSQAKWIQLFNGKDLSGWTPKFKGHQVGVNYKNTFKVENGVLKVDYSEYDKFDGEFGHLFWKQRLSHYRIRAEYRFVGDQVAGAPGWGYRNNGIMIFSEPPETMELDQEFPASIEVQMLGGGGPGDQNNGSFCTPHTRAVFNGQLTTTHRTSAKSKVYVGDDWVTFEVEVHGGKLIKHILDGETVISYSQPQLNPSDPHSRLLMEKGFPQLLESGYIAIQAETHPTEFRRIEILPLEEPL
ncbi:3-keto-disaccharide hydrolase [Pseudoduganella lutea]|uniref:DUF1080 domain-containing protein n=1 Tax=Pseudoduganella lutea TaxID=321985 RepID=A0A4P6L4A2_9BURK|nr:DUF1080 domain-containing protein [Pseudoduganella lutea]QBE66399.1 DUF1080 domain-containing protein [Pseudoduganella lutea]